MISQHCLNSLKPGDKIYLEGYPGYLIYSSKHKTMYYDQLGYCILTFDGKKGFPASIFENSFRFIKIVKK